MFTCLSFVSCLLSHLSFVFLTGNDHRNRQPVFFPRHDDVNRRCVFPYIGLGESSILLLEYSVEYFIEYSSSKIKLELH